MRERPLTSLLSPHRTAVIFQLHEELLRARLGKSKQTLGAFSSILKVGMEVKCLTSRAKGTHAKARDDAWSRNVAVDVELEGAALLALSR